MNRKNNSHSIVTPTCIPKSKIRHVPEGCRECRFHRSSYNGEKNRVIGEKERVGRNVWGPGNPLVPRLAQKLTRVGDPPK